MKDELLKTLEGKVDRRGFLRGSGLAAAALVGATAFPLSVGAQDQTPQEKPQKKPKEKPEPPPENKEEKPENKEDKEPDPFKITKKDADGRDYRMCPQCGYNMYKQDRTWTCENCGYSYIE